MDITLGYYYEKYKKANSAVSFFHWLEGEVQSIMGLSVVLGYSTVEDLRKACKKLEKTNTF
jgi:hypothetical protein